MTAPARGSEVTVCRVDKVGRTLGTGEMYEKEQVKNDETKDNYMITLDKGVNRVM